MENKILAVVDERNVTQEHMSHLKQTIGPERIQQFSGSEGEAKLLQELINQELFYSYALENGYESDQEYLNEVEVVKANLLKSFAIRKYLGEVSYEKEELEAYYTSNKEQFLSAETVQASHILVAEEALARNIKSEITSGKSFEEAAKEHSTCPSKERGGDLGSFGRGQMVPEFEQVAFELPLNSVSDPVKTQFGYHLIKVMDKSEAKTMSFEEVEGQIASHILHKKQNEAYFNKIENLKEQYKVEVK